MTFIQSFRLKTFLLVCLTLNGLTGAVATGGDRLPACRETIERHIRELASEKYQGRSGPFAAMAAKYIQREFQELELNPLFAGNSYLQTIPGLSEGDEPPRTLGTNVGAILPGSDPALAEEYVLIAAHHDHLGRGGGGIFHGADDNASGVAMVLEVARLLKSADPSPRRSVIFVSFDLEEHLLFGSRWFTAHPPIPLERLRLVLVADMLGRSLGDLPLNSVFLFGAEHGTGLRELLAGIDSEPNTRPLLLNSEFVGTRSDYGPFRDRQIPFLFASTGQSRDYHSIRDTADHINYQQVREITTFLREVVRHAANADSSPEWIPDPELTLDEVTTVLKIVEKIDQQADNWKLTTVQRLFVTQTRQRAKRILQQQTISPEDRRWLTRSTQMMLLTVF